MKQTKNNMEILRESMNARREDIVKDLAGQIVEMRDMAKKDFERFVKLIITSAILEGEMMGATTMYKGLVMEVD